MPWTMTRVEASRRMLILVHLPTVWEGRNRAAIPGGGRSIDRRAREFDDLLRRLPCVRARLDSVLLEDGAALLLARAAHAHDERELHAQVVLRGHEPAGDLVATRDAAEDVHEHALHARVHKDHAERVLDHLCPSAAADVAEVGRVAAGALHQVEGAHAQP